MAVQPTRTVDFDRANEVVQRFQKESTKWLYGLDDARGLEGQGRVGDLRRGGDLAH